MRISTRPTSRGSTGASWLCSAFWLATRGSTACRSSTRTAASTSPPRPTFSAFVWSSSGFSSRLAALTATSVTQRVYAEHSLQSKRGGGFGKFGHIHTYIYIWWRNGQQALPLNLVVLSSRPVRFGAHRRRTFCAFVDVINKGQDLLCRQKTSMTSG